METRSFVILAKNKSNVESQIEKLNKRARRLNLEEISISFGKAYMQTRLVTSNYVTQSKDYLVLPVEISGPFDVHYNGWEFVATIQHLPGGENLILRDLTDNQSIPQQYYTSDCNCEHCNVNRYRKDTYVLRHRGGIYKKVGSTCIKDFLGGNSPDNILNRATFVADIISFMEVCGENESTNGEPAYHIESFLANTAACIRQYGWISRTKANESGIAPTSQYVIDNINNMINVEITDEDVRIAKLAVEWAENISDLECENSDYLFNIRAIVRSGMVVNRAVGFAASIINSYRNFLDRNKVNTSVHVGILKKRETFSNLTLKKHFSFPSQWGMNHKFIFNDSDGNVLLWSTTSSQDLEEGKSYLIKGTVKEHTEYKNVKQTIITRCEVLGGY